MSDLRTKPYTPVVLDRFEPTTKKCCECGNMKPKDEIGLDIRTYTCDSCGLVIDRDLNSAINMWLHVPAERRELAPVDIKAATEMMGYFNGIPFVSASPVEEAGSHRVTGGSSLELGYT